VQGGDRGLDLVATRALQSECGLQDAHALGDLARVPQRAVLAVERDDPARRVEPRGEPSVVEQHQREQAARLRLRRLEREHAGEADRFARQVHPPGVAGGIDEVQHAQDHREVARLVQALPAQRALGAADPLRQRRLRDVERVSDLARGEAADGAQRQRHLGRRRKISVAAAEQQEEGVVARVLHHRSRRLREQQLLAPYP
jgi:hypothetical protein